MINRAVKYLPILLPVFDTKRTKEILRVNPVKPAERTEPENIKITVYDYNHTDIKEYTYNSIDACPSFIDNENVTWINVDGIKKQEVEEICTKFKIHSLITEDILSFGQRPKIDEIDNLLYCLLYMLYFNEKKNAIEQEQISIVLGKDFVMSFQEDAMRDVFNPMREKLKLSKSRLRQGSADYLCYAMIDMIVDNYYTVLEKLGEKIENLEEDIIRNANTRSLARINNLRKELIVLKRNFAPVREVVNGFINSDSEWLQERTTKYFKDVYDHIVQANDLVENYRDMMMSLQDLYLNKINLKLNEVMKVMAIVTCLLAPATLIGSIFGMNFEVIPLTHQKMGFYFAVVFMVITIIVMVIMFRRRKWF